MARSILPGDYTNKIIESIKRGTTYKLGPDLYDRVIRSKEMGYRPGEEVRAMARRGEFDENRIKFVLQTIDEMNYVTVRTLMQQFRFLSRLNTKRRFGRYENHKQLDTFLKDLGRKGLLFSYSFRDQSNKDAAWTVMYFVTENGHSFYNRRLDISTPYDKEMSNDGMDRVFPYLVTNRAIQAFTRSRKCIDVKYGQSYKKARDLRMDLTLSENSTFMRNIYGEVTMQDDNGLKHHYFIEPIRFTTPPDSVNTPETMNARAYERVMWLKTVIENEESKAADPNEVFFVLFLVEDIDGLRRLGEILKSIDADSFFENHAYVSSDFTIVDAFACDIGHAMLGMKFTNTPDGKKVHFEYAETYIDFEIPQEWILLSEGANKTADTGSTTYI